MDDKENPCICGHVRRTHYGTPNKPAGWIGGNMYCWYFNSCGCKVFKLDNLMFIEDLAKEKGLI